MLEDSKKNQNKGPKDQRKPRNRHQAGSVEKKVEKRAEESKALQKPVYEEPGPEFYKNLKRETDEILKITEEASSKYKKKEIQSNWSKYEIPIESYDEIEEQENMGADYEKLIEAPLSVGGHFQFKHEKSWDVETGPSLYDKYFEVNTDNLFLSIATIPFHEKINAHKSIFTETDMLTMNNRATRFKQKYYKDKTFTTPELTSQDNIIRSLKDNVEKTKDYTSDDDNVDIEDKQEPITREESISKKIHDIEINTIKLENQNNESETLAIASDNSLSIVQVEPSDILVPKKIIMDSKDLDNFEDLISDNEEKNSPVLEAKLTIGPDTNVEKDIPDKQKQSKPETKNPVIESPEDLEKWLDDFLDG